MIQVNCPFKNCDLPIQEVEHVKAAIHFLEEHYNVVHPRKAFYLESQLNRIERYNEDLNEVMMSYYGENWAQPGNVGAVVNYINRYMLVPNGTLQFCATTIAEGRKFVEEHPLDVAQAQAQPIQVQEEDDLDVPPPPPPPRPYRIRPRFIQ